MNAPEDGGGVLVKDGFQTLGVFGVSDGDGVKDIIGGLIGIIKKGVHIESIQKIALHVDFFRSFDDKSIL